MNKDELKQQAATVALDYIVAGDVIGIGSGSTVNAFIDALAGVSAKIEAAVAASVESERRLCALGIEVVDLNSVGNLSVYFDGADEFTINKDLLKGGGGALTREKVLASMADKFICMADSSKQVEVLGGVPLAVEVLPMARSFVARKLRALGGTPVYREAFVTDNNNVILDVHGLDMIQPAELEKELTLMPGVVECGVFSARRADLIVLAAQSGVTVF
jgi:ribose 5-phosphate isomerase A